MGGRDRAFPLDSNAPVTGLDFHLPVVMRISESECRIKKRAADTEKLGEKVVT